jgi:ribosome biogenesis protein Nip4
MVNLKSGDILHEVGIHVKCYIFVFFKQNCYVSTLVKKLQDTISRKSVHMVGVKVFIRTTSSQSISATALQKGLKSTVVIASIENKIHL